MTEKDLAKKAYAVWLNATFAPHVCIDCRIVDGRLLALMKLQDHDAQCCVMHLDKNWHIHPHEGVSSHTSIDSGMADYMGRISQWEARRAVDR